MDTDRLRKIADIISKEWGREEWEKYKTEHPRTKIHPIFKEDPKKPEVKNQEFEPAPEIPAIDSVGQVEERRQPFNTKEEVYKSGQVALGQMKSWLDANNEVEKELGLKVADVPPEEFDFEHSKGPVLFMAPLKSEARAREKVEADYKGDWSRISDLVRASIAVDSFDDVGKVADVLKRNGMKLAKQPKNRFKNVTPVGYRDILLNVVYPNGHVGEVQLHVKPMLIAKEKVHKYYETTRSIDAKMEKEQRKMRTEQEEELYQEAVRESKRMYNQAWARAMKKASSVNRISDDDMRYYDYNGVPTYVKKKHVPIGVVDGKNKPFYNTWKFLHEAFEITKEAFNKLFKK